LEIDDWENLKPCPFCGAGLDDTMNERDWQIVCFMCGARGPRFEGDMKEALRRWNSREDG
jgi:Lar family restriction alleviation protein